MRSGFGDVLKNPLVIGLLATHVAKNLVDSYGQAKQNAMMPDPTEEAAKQQALAEGHVVTEMPNTGLFHRILGIGPESTPLSSKAIAGEKIALRGRGMEDLDAAAKVATLAKAYGSGNTEAMLQGPFGSALRNAGVNIPTNLPYATPQEELVDWKNAVNQRMIDQYNVINQLNRDKLEETKSHNIETELLKANKGTEESLKSSRIVNTASRLLFGMDPLSMKYQKPQFQMVAEQMLEQNATPSQVSEAIKKLADAEEAKANEPSGASKWFSDALSGLGGLLTGSGPTSSSAGSAPSAAPTPVVPWGK